MMGLGQVLRRTALRYPQFGAMLLRAYLHSVKTVPPRVAWIVDGLKRDIPCHWRQRVVRLSGGGRLYVDSSSDVGRQIFFRGSYEPTLLAVLQRWLRPGMTFIDAGANIGEFSIRAARIVGRTGQVHAFEASPDTFQDLVRNIELNQASNIRAHQIALSGRAGTVTFYLSRGVASGSSSLRPAHDFSGRATQVTATTIDEFVRSMRIGRIDLIKMDIEGAELDALTGSAAVLGGPNPPVIVFEHHPDAAARFGVTRAKVQAFLETFGYNLRPISASAGSDGTRTPENILAVPAGRI